MMVWVDIIAVLLCSIVGSIIGIVVMFRPLTNAIAARVHRKMMRQISAGEDKFASRGKI